MGFRKSGLNGPASDAPKLVAIRGGGAVPAVSTIGGAGAVGLVGGVGAIAVAVVGAVVVEDGGAVALGLPGAVVGEQTGEALFSPPECLACGGCCFSTASDYVPVKGDDWTRLGADAERWAVFVNNRAFMRMSHGHCAALRVEAAPAGHVGKRYVCSIYATRPQVCRDLARGSAECHGEWSVKHRTAADAVQ